MIKHSIQEIIQSISKQPESSIMNNIEGLDEEEDFRECVDSYASDLLSLIGIDKKQAIGKMTDEDLEDSVRHTLLLFLIFMRKNDFIEFRNQHKRSARGLVMQFEKGIKGKKNYDSKKKA